MLYSRVNVCSKLKCFGVLTSVLGVHLRIESSGEYHRQDTSTNESLRSSMIDSRSIKPHAYPDNWSIFGPIDFAVELCPC